MKKPKNRGTAIDIKRYRTWVQEFSSYRHSVPEGRIRDWIALFDEGDRDVAARVLDCVDFFSHEQISAAFKTILSALDGWHKDEAKRSGKWRFIAYSASAGESGDTMLAKFRHANNLAGQQHNELFIHRSDILREGLGFDDVVVLVDDFIGTGDQACSSWNEIYGELLAEVGRVYLVVVAARDKAIEVVGEETSLEVVPHFPLRDSDNVFDSSCKFFNSEEKARILKYCEKVDRKEPKGRGDCGLLVVFSHTIPNNSIPILSKRSKHWEPLFSRYD